jgi:hypothetical protein
MSDMKKPKLDDYNLDHGANQYVSKHGTYLIDDLEAWGDELQTELQKLEERNDYESILSQWQKNYSSHLRKKWTNVTMMLAKEREKNLALQKLVEELKDDLA